MESNEVKELFPEADTLTEKQFSKAISSIDIPACPVIVARAMAESRKDEPNLLKLCDLIAADPSLSAMALKLVNSSLFRSNAPISCVRQAVERLGTRVVTCIVIAGALRSAFDGSPAAWLEKFWRRTRQSAVGAAVVARRQIGIAPDAAYTYALFQDAAIPIMMKRFKDYEQVVAAARSRGLTRADAENAYFSYTHVIAGALLVRNWGLPAIFEKAIRFHHDADAYELPERTLPGEALSFIAVTQIAERLTAEVLDSPDVETGTALFERALHCLAIADHELDDLRHRVALALDAV